MMFRPEVPKTSRKAVLEEIGRLVIESPPLRTSGGPSRYCADPGGRDILATPEEIAAARCGDCKKLTTLAARRAIDAGAKRVEVAMTVTDEPDEHVFMIVDGEFRDPAREAGMPCRIIDLFIPVTIWPLSEFGNSAPVDAGTAKQIQSANASAAEETSVNQNEAPFYQAQLYASGSNAGGDDEMALALHEAHGTPFTVPHRRPYIFGPDDETRRAQGPADTLANLGLVDAWSQNAQTQWNIDTRAQGPREPSGTPKPIGSVPSMPVSGTTAPKSMTQPVAPVPPAMSSTPKSMPSSVSHPVSPPGGLGTFPSGGRVAPEPPHDPGHESGGSSVSQPSTPQPTRSGHFPISPISPGHGDQPSYPNGTGSSTHPAQRPWQPVQPPVEGVTRNGGHEVWRGGGWVANPDWRPGLWREGEFRTASDGTRLIFRRGDWVRADETSQVVVFSDGSFRVYFLDGRFRQGLPGEAYPEGYPVFYDVATLPLGPRFSFFVSGISAYRLDNYTGKLLYLGQYMPEHTVLVGAVLYHPRPDGTLVWIGPLPYGVNPQADANLITYQSASPEVLAETAAPPAGVVRPEAAPVWTPRVSEDLEVFHDRSV